MQTTNTENLFRTEAELEAEQARHLKGLRLKDVGEPIDLGAKVIKLVVRGEEAWTAESTKVVRRIDLKTGKILQVYKGHSGPVTSLVFYDFTLADGQPKSVLITGSWDKTIRIWDIETKEVISQTDAHGDFVKTLLVIPSAKILVSGSSDKTAKLWDLSEIDSSSQKPLGQLASLPGHRRPVEVLAARDHSLGPLVTADSMGVLKIWTLEERSPSNPSNVRATLREDVTAHRTGINDASFGSGHLWTASTDQTVTLRKYPSTLTSEQAAHTLEHVNAVKCILPLAETLVGQPYLLTANGDAIRVYDVSELVEEQDPEDSKKTKVKGQAHLLNEVDAHSHGITSLQVWMRTSPEKPQPEAWIVSSSLDGTLRRWRLSDLIEGSPPAPKPVSEPAKPAEAKSQTSLLTEEEERELAELMDDDD